jgi:hypothetical protein
VPAKASTPAPEMRATARTALVGQFSSFYLKMLFSSSPKPRLSYGS